MKANSKLVGNKEIDKDRAQEIKSRRRAAWKRMVEKMKENRKNRKAADGGLTIKQRKFVREYLRTGNSLQSVLAVYNTKNKRRANFLGYQLRHYNEKVKNAIQRALEAQDLTEDYAARKLKDVIEEGSKNLGDTKPSDYLKALEVVFRLRGYLGGKKDATPRERLEDVAQKMTVRQLAQDLRRLDKKQRELLEIMRGEAKDGEIID